MYENRNVQLIKNVFAPIVNPKQVNRKHIGIEVNIKTIATFEWRAKCFIKNLKKLLLPSKNI